MQVERNLLLWAAEISTAFPVAAGIINYRNLKKDMKILLFLFVVGTIIEMVATLINEHINWTRYIYVPLEYCLFMLVLSSWQENRNIKNITLWSIPLFIGICLISVLFRKDFTFIDSTTISLSCVLYASICLFTLIGLLYKDTGSLYKHYIFWICSGLLLYSANGVIFYSLTNYFQSTIIWQIGAIATIISNICYVIGFLCYRPQ
jgi:hypothetical protein